MRNYYEQTVATNGMLVIDPKEFCHTRKKIMPTQDDGGFYPVYGGQRTHRGGSNCFSFEEFLSRMSAEDDRFECGDITAFEAAADSSYTYVRGDATANYNSPTYVDTAGGRKNRPKIDRFTRSLAWLGNKYLVVFDRVNALDSTFRKAWLLHSQGKPEVSGRLVTADVPGHIEDFDGDTVTITWSDGVLAPPEATDPGRLFCRTLLPAKRVIRRIGGAGYEFWANGRNWPPPRKGTAQSDPQDTGNWRVEISPAEPAKFDNFLHLLYPCDTKTAKMPASTMLESKDGRRVGLSVGGWLVLFGRRGEVGGEIRYNAPAGRTEHLLVDLPRGSRYNVTGLTRAPKPLAVSKEGTLRFATDAAGEVRLTPVPSIRKERP